VVWSEAVTAPEIDYMGPAITVDNGQVFTAEPSGADFGPQPEANGAPTDFTADTGAKPRRGRPKAEPRPAGEKRWGLGANKSAVRSTVPNLTNADREKIAALYLMAGKAIEPFKEEVGQILQRISGDAADGWVELAKENATVRRWLRALLEGGAWSKVFVAHSPLIMLAVQPMMSKMMMRRMGLSEEDMAAAEAGFGGATG
jgi:hypothetical protein